MNIATLKGLDHGIAQLKFAGQVGYVGNVREFQGRNGQPFYTQFIVVQDDTGSIGVDLRLGNNRAKALTMAHKGQRIECWGGTIIRYVDKQGKKKVAMRAFGEVQGGHQTMGSTPVSNPAILKTARQSGRQWVPDRERDYYILVENINTAIAGIVEAAITHGNYNPGQAAGMIKNLGQTFLDLDLELLEQLKTGKLRVYQNEENGVGMSASGSVGVPGPIESPIDLDEVPF